jgi:uncharacterized protein (DUF433 family)
MDWTGCDLVERVPGRCSGVPTVVGTRIFPDTIVGDYELGSSVEEIHQNFPSLSMEVIQELIRFAESHRAQQVA